MADFKVNRVNRNFGIKVHLYHNQYSYNRLSDATPRFYLKPVKLLSLEKIAFTREGAGQEGYEEYGNRFWRYKGDSTLTEAVAEAIFDEIKLSYPYGFVDSDKASQNKYYYDVINDDAFQSYYKTYWEDHQSEVIQPQTQADGTLDYPHPYIEFDIDEIINYKHVTGTVSTLPTGVALYEIYNTGTAYQQPVDYSCNDETIDVHVNPNASGNFVIDGFGNYLIKLSASGRYRFDLLSGTQPLRTWPTGLSGTFHSGYRFRFSTGDDGTHNGYSEYTSGVSYVESPELGYYYLGVQVKTDGNHPYYNTGSTSGYVVSGSGGSATGINSYTEGATLTLRRESTYYFMQESGSNSGHPMHISTGASGQNSHVYTSGVTHLQDPYNAGTAGAYTLFTVPAEAPDTLYYACKNHSHMGGQINVIDSPAAPKTGSIPGESIVWNVGKTGSAVMYYYSPEVADMGGTIMIKTGCGSSDLF